MVWLTTGTADAQSKSLDPDALLITAGNSQAISHAAMAFSKHNKRVFVEEPTYFLSHDIFRELGLELASIPVDDRGLDVRGASCIYSTRIGILWGSSQPDDP